MKILVTGASGFIGRGVVKALVRNGDEVIATDFCCKGVTSAVKCVEVDLFEVEDPYTFFGKPDVLLHLAWRDGFVHNSGNHMNDLPKHYVFIKTMIESGMSQICIMGSMHEVGFFEGSIDENTPTNPQSLYGISKNALRQTTELLIEHNTILQWIRGFYIVGNEAVGNSIFSKIVQAERAGNTEFPFTQGINQFDFIDYDDFCEQVVAVVQQKKVIGIINCCSGSPISLAERVERFIKDNRFEIKLKYGAFPDRPYDSKAIWGNNQKIQQIMNNKGI